MIAHALAVFSPLCLIASKRRRCCEDLIDRLSEMLGDVELVVHQLGVRKLMCHRVGIGWKHVGSDRPNLLSLLNRQRLEDGLGSRLGTFRDHVKNAGTIEISEDGNVVMPLPEALLVDAQMWNVRRLPTLQAPCDRAIHDVSTNSIFT